MVFNSASHPSFICLLKETQCKSTTLAIFHLSTYLLPLRCINLLLSKVQNSRKHLPFITGGYLLNEMSFPGYYGSRLSYNLRKFKLFSYFFRWQGLLMHKWVCFSFEPLLSLRLFCFSFCHQEIPLSGLTLINFSVWWGCYVLVFFFNLFYLKLLQRKF